MTHPASLFRRLQFDWFFDIAPDLNFLYGGDHARKGRFTSSYEYRDCEIDPDTLLHWRVAGKPPFQ